MYGKKKNQKGVGWGTYAGVAGGELKIPEKASGVRKWEEGAVKKFEEITNGLEKLSGWRQKKGKGKGGRKENRANEICILRVIGRNYVGEGEDKC